MVVQDVRRSAIRLLKDEDGATLVEYVLLTALVAIVAILAMRFLGNTASNKLQNVGTTIS